jgi:outer membrane murein-binding lipoprotein Lpp
MFGSGTSYAADFQKVVKALGSVAALSPTTLSQNTFISETRTQTQVLNSSMQQLLKEIQALRTAVAQASSAPARAA